MAVIKNNTMMITHYNRRLILSNQLSVGYIPICMQILDLSRRNWQMGGKIHERYKYLWIYASVIQGAK